MGLQEVVSSSAQENRTYPLWTGGAAVNTAIVLVGLLDVEQLTPGLGIDLGGSQSLFNCHVV